MTVRLALKMYASNIISSVSGNFIAKIAYCKMQRSQAENPVRIDKLILLVAAGSLTSSHFDNSRQSHVCHLHVELLKFPENVQSDA